jgi:hypothetical protein
MKLALFWLTAPYSLVEVSEMLTASIIRTTDIPEVVQCILEAPCKSVFFYVVLV